ncbi:MAG TPA: MFS transporter [Trebonia sp.]|jgi:MFS family permease|nr:MFS transporter [Trebonia sp.]
MTDLTDIRPLPVTRRLARGRADGAGAARPVRPGLVLAIVLTGQLMAVIDNSIVNVAVPSMAASLHASGALLQLIVAGYTISYAVLLVTGARLGDIAGHRRMFLAGAALFTLASLGCGLAPSAGWLVGLRFVQGVGAAVMIPQVLSLIQRTYTEPGPRARAMSFYAAVLSGGAVLGQVLGGLLVSADLFGSAWRPIFLVNVPVGLVLLALGRLLPAADAGRPQRRLDLPGLFTLTPAVLAFVLPLVLGQSLGWPAWGWALLGIAVVLAVALGPVERLVHARGGQPIMPRALLRAPGIATGIGGMFATMAIFGGWLFVFTLHLQDGLGDSPLRSGLTFVPAALAFAAVSLNWQRVPAGQRHILIVGGFVVNGLALLGLGLLLAGGGTGGDATYVLAALSGGGMAAGFGPLMTRVLSRVPVALAADASGVIVTVNQLGIVGGVATFGTLFLNLAGLHGAGLASAHAFEVSSIALAATAIVGGTLAAFHVATRTE